MSFPGTQMLYCPSSLVIPANVLPVVVLVANTITFATGLFSSVPQSTKPCRIQHLISFASKNRSGTGLNGGHVTSEGHVTITDSGNL